MGGRAGVVLILGESELLQGGEQDAVGLPVGEPRGSCYGIMWSIVGSHIWVEGVQRTPEDLNKRHGALGRTRTASAVVRMATSTAGEVNKP